MSPSLGKQMNMCRLSRNNSVCSNQSNQSNQSNHSNSNQHHQESIQNQQHLQENQPAQAQANGQALQQLPESFSEPSSPSAMPVDEPVMNPLAGDNSCQDDTVEILPQVGGTYSVLLTSPNTVSEYDLFLGRCLGRGAFSKVFEGCHTRTKTSVAVKAIALNGENTNWYKVWTVDVAAGLISNEHVRVNFNSTLSRLGAHSSLLFTTTMY